MIGYLLHAAWAAALLALAVYDRPALRTRLAARAHRRWRSTRRTAAALWRAATLHPRHPEHAKERHA
ncbi:hypothetical protein GCM10017559_07930 [Streptosporangium longisporum]|uniref:Uncharacterized protein n=1 Tax=Streptosporangium longisporum TaxID=46187 RepID=A0ABN3XRM3_9ACTN